MAAIGLDVGRGVHIENARTNEVLTFDPAIMNERAVFDSGQEARSWPERSCAYYCWKQ
jgi:hypothetical protein